MTATFATFEDNALIKLTLEGQAECFTVLMDRHLAAVRRCIGSLVRSAADAEDIVQEVVLKVWRRLSSFRAQSSFRTWLTSVAVNEARQSYRRQHRRPLCLVPDNLDGFRSPGERPDQSLVRTHDARTVRRAVAALPAKYRQVLVLRYLEELSPREIAEGLQSNLPTVKTRLFRARRMLLRALQPRLGPKSALRISQS